jgi:alkylation response protein AidB-like acyl-CoA dehydrogenase
VTAPSADHSRPLAAFEQEVRTWLAEEMRDGLRFAWSATWSNRVDDAEYAFRRRLARALGRRGWLFPTYPTGYGGGGLTPEHQAVLERELGRYGLRLAMVFYTLARIVAPCILQHGTEDQRRALLPGLLRGEVVVWQVLTEPQSGSDVADCRTTARRDGDDYVVSGQKVMVGSHQPPDYLWTLVNTDPGGKRHENLSWLYIPASSPGITMTPMAMLMGIKNAVFFDDCRVPATNLVGGENNGWQVSSTHLELEHGGAGSLSGDPAVDEIVARCQEERGGEPPLLARPEIRAILADMLIETHVCQLLAARNYWLRLRRTPHPYGGAQYRYYERLLRLRNAERVQRIFGYEALVPRAERHEDADLEHLVRAGPGQLHGGGTMDTDRLIIARRMGIGRASNEDAPTTA